ncbi:UMP kinase [Candidatus Nomurabacteria bacterium]|nr:UMP kinase [Candidatus Nomurabacteria bacterium]MCB9820740.1 UMP kinase [Candidatus Nomurabacteria bacterium]
MKEVQVISLGGSLIFPDNIDTDYIKSFIDLVREEVSKGKRFIIIAGGGRLARRYQDALKEFDDESEALDWVGIHSTRLNAEFVKMAFGDMANTQIITSPDMEVDWNEDVILGAGWKPGRSTDYIAVELAKKFGAKKVINISNVEYVYSKDPKKYPDAQIMKDIDWDTYLGCIPEKWEPGLSTPFDPEAARNAKSLDLEVDIILGQKLEDLRKSINNQDFDGTRIK